MYDASINAKTIARQFRPFDFVSDPTLLNEEFKQEIIADAVKIGQTGYIGLRLKQSKLRGNAIYQFEGLTELLVARHIAANVKRITGVKQDNRQFIIECLRSLLREGIPFRAYKLDIRGFYENIDASQILQKLRSNEGFSGQSALSLRSFFHELQSQSIHGLPRGIGLSATLAEYFLKDFDETVSNHPEVWFFVRFVDDIFVITSGRECSQDFETKLARALPHGLAFNAKKRSVMDFQKFSKSQTGIEHSFSYLGYEFHVTHIKRNSLNRTLIRDVTLDIASSKVRKIKIRVMRAMIAFKRDNDYDLLRSRIRLLTSNFNFIDRQTTVRRVSGIYFNYPMTDFAHSKSLPALDRFLKNVIMSSHPKNKWRPTITKSQRLELLNLTFSGGFQSKRFFNFGPSLLANLVSCWRYA